MRAYILCLMTACFVILCASAALNFVVDSENNFGLRGEGGRSIIQRYVAKLRSSKSGLVMIDQDRLVKAELARQSSDDCYVIGSSRVFQLDATTVSEVFEQCRGVTNLSVSAGGFEDLVALAGILMARQDNLRLFIEIAPWSLRPNPSTIWTEYEDAYDRGRAIFGLLKQPFRLSRVFGEWGTLFRADYTIMNLKFAVKHCCFQSGAEKAARIVAGVPSQDAKEDEVVNLPNGRISYPTAILQSVPPDPAMIGDGSFNILEPAVDPTTVAELEHIVGLMTRRGHKLAFLMAPYNPSVMACKTAFVCRTMKMVESFVREASIRWGAPLIGSFDPRPFRLEKQDFMDDMHLLLSGVAKLRKTT